MRNGQTDRYYKQMVVQTDGERHREIDRLTDWLNQAALCARLNIRQCETLITWMVHVWVMGALLVHFIPFVSLSLKNISQWNSLPLALLENNWNPLCFYQHSHSTLICFQHLYITLITQEVLYQHGSSIGLQRFVLCICIKLCRKFYFWLSLCLLFCYILQATGDECAKK